MDRPATGVLRGYRPAGQRWPRQPVPQRDGRDAQHRRAPRSRPCGSGSVRNAGLVSDPMPKVAVAAKITCKPGVRDELVAAFKPMLDHVQSESGTELYLLSKDAREPDVLWFFEMYS